MCFSAEASFTAAAILGGCGVFTLKNVTSRSQFFLAVIPLLFAIQQASEGFLWLHLNYQIGSYNFLMQMQHIFLTFAFMTWPVWIPLAFLATEGIRWRQVVLGCLMACGIYLCFINISSARVQESSVKIVNHSIQYLGHFPTQEIPYAMATVLPCFISSLRNAWMIGIISLITFLIAEYFYYMTLVSVWCFFAAITSLLIYKILKDNQVSRKTPLL